MIEVNGDVVFFIFGNFFDLVWCGIYDGIMFYCVVCEFVFFVV